MEDDDRCAICDRLIRKVSKRRKVIETEEEETSFSALLGKRISIGDAICDKCRKRAYKTRTDEDIEPDAESTSDEDPAFQPGPSKSTEAECVKLELPRTISTHRYCCICGSSKPLTKVPEKARLQAYTVRRIYIPSENRCCANHLIHKQFYEECLPSLKVYSHYTEIRVIDLQKLMELLAIRSDRVLMDKVADFTLPAEQLIAYTGLDWDNIIQLRGMLTSLRDSDLRTATQAIVVFLMKLRTGNSNALIASILQLKSPVLVSQYSQSVIKAFETDILPRQFGVFAKAREDLISNHTSFFTKHLFNVSGQLVLICDGTYIRHEKSKNNDYQRKSYSGQKKTSLCKPFTVSTTDGYILDMFGPFYAKQNDAAILNIILNDRDGLSKILEKGDIFILDRGFRDIKDDLEAKGFRVLMPANKGSRKQLTSAEANYSRFVTKIRWVVESVHAMIKIKFKLFDRQLDNKMLPKVAVYIRIACFLQNHFGKRLSSDEALQDIILSRMIAAKDTEDTLGNEVIEKGWNRKKVIFSPLSSHDLKNFPQISETDLQILFTGSYQLSRAVCYLAEILNVDGSVNRKMVKDSTNILQVVIPSRHVNKREYRCYIDYIPDGQGYKGINRYSCECANGRRTVGCCSHIAAIIYYLGHARYLSRIIKPAEILSKIFTNTNTMLIIDEDSDLD